MDGELQPTDPVVGAGPYFCFCVFGRSPVRFTMEGPASRSGSSDAWRWDGGRLTTMLRNMHIGGLAAAGTRERAT